MKSDIESNIAEYLRRNGKLGIPGLGSFETQNVSENFTLVNNVLSPPKGLFVFDDQGETKDSNFAKYLGLKLGLSKSKTETALKKYGQDLLNSLLNYGAVSIPKVGKLVKSSSNEIKFKSVELSNSVKYFNLPQIKLQPVTGVVENASTSIPAAPKAIATTAAMATAAVATINPVPKVKKASINETFIQPEKAVEPVKKVVTPQKETSTPIVEPVNYYDNESSGSILSWLWPILAILLLGAICFFGYKKCAEIMSTKAGTAIEETEVKEDDTSNTTNNTETAKAFKEMVKNDPILKKYAEVLTPQIVESGCIIVVGSFKKARNVLKMKTKIIRADLDPYTESYQDYTRVGIRFECADRDLIENIKSIRRQFSRNAWYLQPDLEVR